MNIKLEKALIINRPSKSIKSPYLADIKINDEIVLAHSPALGLCGLIINNVNVLVSKCENDCRKSKYTIELVKVNDPENKKSIWIGGNPNYGNKLFSYFFKEFSEFNKFNIEKSEIKIGNSRLDFLLTNTKEKFYVEVKNVPLVDYNPKLHDIKQEKLTYSSLENYSRAAVFPDGYKNSKNQCISDRAYKHLDELIELKNKGFRTALVFIIQREDPEYFRPNYLRDKIYSEKLKEAFDKGVEIYAYKFKWTSKNNIGSCNFIKKIPIKLECI
jgi:sugar fermentation stimulation protein A